jgi:hypothetical protein
MAFATIDVTKGITGTIPVANGGTGVASGTTGQFLKFTGSTTLASAAVDTGNYSVHAVAEYGETSTYDFTSSAHPVTISDESCTLTATSTSDIFIASGSVMAYSNNSSGGFGILVKKDTVSDFSNDDGSGNFWLYQSGRYAIHSQSSNFYNLQSFNFQFTLPNTTQHYFRIYGMVQCSSGLVRFNNDAYATTENARHKLMITQYKYNG